jgi:hypothetical protein
MSLNIKKVKLIDWPIMNPFSESYSKTLEPSRSDLPSVIARLTRLIIRLGVLAEEDVRLAISSSW